jgi:hypothetical protein
MQRFAGLAFLLATACGGRLDLPADVDAPAADGDGGLDAPSDALADAELDAPPPAPFSGRFSLVEALVATTGAPAPYGQGLEARIVFTDSTQVPAPFMQSEGGPLGCKAWQYTPAQALAADVGVDEGATFLAFAGGSSPATPPVFPACTYAAGVGYRCVDNATASSGGVIALGPAAGTATLTDADVTYTAANAAGRWLRLTGAASPANDGLFPILAVTAAHTVSYANGGAVAEVLPGLATHVDLAGVGAIPAVVDPGFLADDVAVTVNHVAGGGNHVPAFTLMTEGPGHAGDDFTLDVQGSSQLTHVPLDGADLTFACESNCGTDSAAVTEVRLITTDAPLAGLARTAMPAPVTRRVEVRCTRAGTGTVTVPAAYMARIASAGATRIEARVTRGALLTWPEPPVIGLVGHALVGFTDP